MNPMKERVKKKFRLHRLNQIQYIAVGFAMIIFIGALLLMLPFAARDGETTTFVNALLTATSATCVTGLVAYDTYQHWTLFGQLIIITLIQIGGLGFITFGVGFSVLFRRHIGLRQRDLMKESVNAMELGGIIRLWKKIVLGTLIFEGVGAALLAIRFSFDFGVIKGIYYGIFHSISAFCNGGFDLMGCNEAFSSVTAYVADPLINIVFCLLILIGGLGFSVWAELAVKKWHWKKYSLHTKIVMFMLIFLVGGGTLGMYLCEKNNTLVGMSGWGQLWASLFGAVTARTAGFNTVDTAALTPAGKLLTIALMFIGGNPGSTAGGIKCTTIAVIFAYVFSNIRGNSGVNMFHRRISEEIIQKAFMVFCMNLFLALISGFLILATSNLAMEDVLFEVVSAVSTVGMTTGITRDLNTFGRIIITFLMYCGRVGSMTFALSLIQRAEQQKVRLPIERITIG